MKKVLVLAAALALSAAPAAAQEAQSDAPSVQPVAQQQAVQPGMPSIFVSQDEIRQKVAANEEALSGAQVGSQSWWYLVAAIAVGVIIAALIL